MGRTTYPCPACGQAQTVLHENGEEIAQALCAACEQEAQDYGAKDRALAEQEARDEASGKKEKARR